jgi:peptide/nickel transport system substrate-binding protein
MLVPASALLSAAVNAQANCRKINNIAVCDRFLQEWGKQDSDQVSVYVNGLPVTPRRSEISLADGKMYDTQWFERARYELHPENNAPYDMLLGLLGTSLVEGRGVVDPYTKKVRNSADQPFAGIDKPADADGKRKLWFPETKHSVSGKTLEYWNRYGGLRQFGFPLSEPFQEISEVDNKPYIVQYFERNRFELHPEKAAPYEVELGLLGVQQYNLSPVPGDKLPIAPPVGVKSSKNTLVLAGTAEPRDLFTELNLAGTPTQIVYALWYTLVGVTPSGDFFPELVWYVPTVENGGARFVGFGDDRHLQVKYKMRPGVKWSDGVEITSNDVIFSYKLFTHPDFESCCQPAGDKIYNIDNPDKYIVIFNFLSYAQARDRYGQDKEHFNDLKKFVDKKSPATDYAYVTIGSVLPEHVLKAATPGHIVEKGYWSDLRLLVTSGPFKLERWDAGQQIVLVPNPYYSLTAPPLLSRIVLRFLPDLDTVVAQLKSGDADVSVSQLLSGTMAPGPQIEELKQVGLVVDSAPGNIWEHLDFNLSRPYFREKAVRQAIAYAVNRHKIVEDVSFGLWRVLNSTILPGKWGSEENPMFPSVWKEKYPLHLYPYDPSEANRLLDQAGWKRGADGVRAKDGVRLSFKYSTTDVPVRAKIQGAVSEYLRTVGLDAQPLQLRGDEFFGTVLRGDFDMAEFALAVGSDTYPEPGPYASYEIPTERNGFSGSNVPHYINPRYDQLRDQQAIEITRDAQYPLFAEMQSIISEDVPVLPLHIVTQLGIHSAKLVNWDTGTMNNALYKAQAMYFK